jgi:hypothetical protein
MDRLKKKENNWREEGDRKPASVKNLTEKQIEMTKDGDAEKTKHVVDVKHVKEVRKLSTLPDREIIGVPDENKLRKKLRQLSKDIAQEASLANAMHIRNDILYQRLLQHGKRHELLEIATYVSCNEEEGDEEEQASEQLYGN